MSAVTLSRLGGEVLRFVWLAAPVVVAALVHLVVLRLRWLESLKIPLDAGATWRGRRIFGDHKTVRGVVVMISVSTLTMMLQGVIRNPSLEYFDYGQVNLALVGMLLGLGFILGELPNSFVKRQRGIAPGGHGGVMHALVDQVDSVLGALVTLSLVWVPPLGVWLIALVLGSGLHIAVNSIFVLVRLKRHIF